METTRTITGNKRGRKPEDPALPPEPRKIQKPLQIKDSEDGGSSDVEKVDSIVSSRKKAGSTNKSAAAGPIKGEKMKKIGKEEEDEEEVSDSENEWEKNENEDKGVSLALASTFLRKIMRKFIENYNSKFVYLLTGDHAFITNPDLFITRELSLPIPNRVQNQEQSIQDSVGFPERFRLKLRNDWLDSCVAELKKSNLGFDNLNNTEKEKLIMDRFLFSDMKLSSGSVLPENVHTLDLANLPGPLTLQVNEIVNLSVHPQDRFQDAPAWSNRCLLLTMTDGVRFILGVEIKPIKDLQVSAPAGFKVVIHNPNLLGGLLVLVPEGLKVLGGMVEDLDAARQKSAEEVIDPSKGERTQTGVPPLAIAAWKPKDFVEEPSNRLTANGGRVEKNLEAARNILVEVEEVVEPPKGERMQAGATPPLASSATIESRFIADEREVCAPDLASLIEDDGIASGSMHDKSRQTMSYLIQDWEQKKAEDSSIVTSWKPKYLDEIVKDNSNRLTREQNEMDYTYMDELFDDWEEKKRDGETSALYKVQGLMHGVIKFEFENMSKYQLIVMFRDGSDTSQIFIDHKIVERQIGLTPEMVNHILSTSASDVMRNFMNRYLHMWSSLKGTLIVEMKTGSAVPVAVQVDSTYNASWVLNKTYNASWILNKLDEDICGVGNTDKDYYLESMRIKSEKTRNITSA